MINEQILGLEVRNISTRQLENVYLLRRGKEVFEMVPKRVEPLRKEEADMTATIIEVNAKEQFRHAASVA